YRHSLPTRRSSDLDSLKEKKLLDSFSENVQYFPKEYAEVETDTLLSNGFRVVINIKSKMDSNILVETRKATIQEKRYYRNFIGKVTVFKENTLLLSKEITKLFVENELNNPEVDLSKYRLNNIWISNYFENSKERICLNFEYCKPEAIDYCWRFELFIDESGKYLLKQFEYN